MRPGYLTPKKPGRGAEINWQHPLAQGLFAAFVVNEGGGPPRDLITGYSLPFAGAGVRSIIRVGEVLDLSPSSDAGAQATAWDGLKFASGYRGGFSIAYRGIINASPAAFAQLAGVTYDGSGSSPFQQCSMELNNDGSQYALSWSGNGVLQTFAGSPIASFDGTERLVVGAVGNNDNRIWEMKHGSALKQCASNFSNVGNPYNNTSTSKVRIGVSAKTYTQFAYFYNRRLVEQDVQRLWIDPYGFLQPARQRFVSGGVISTVKFRRTLSASGARIGSRQMVS